MDKELLTIGLFSGNRTTEWAGYAARLARWLPPLTIGSVNKKLSSINQSISQS